MTMRVDAPGELPPIQLNSPDAVSFPTEKIATEGASEASETSFEKIMRSGLAEVSRLHDDAQARTEALAKGLTDDLHGTMISVKEAEISLKLVGTIRNRILDAFHELWRTNL